MHHVIDILVHVSRAVAVAIALALQHHK